MGLMMAGWAGVGHNPVGPRLAPIQEKWEASTEVLVDDLRQNGHDEKEDRD